MANDKTSTRDRAVTRADVARYAGVSTAVVSYVMNGGPRKVAPETAARVREAIAQLDYRPNVHAQALRRGTTEMIGLVLADPTNPFFVEFVAAITEAAYAYGRAVVIASARARPDTELTLVDDLVRRRVDGLIVASVFGRPDLSLGRSHRQTPMVFIDAPGTVPGYASLGTDGLRGAYLAVEHLGRVHHHGTIGLVVGGMDSPKRGPSSRVGNRPFALRGSKTGRSPEWTGHAKAVMRVGTACWPRRGRRPPSLRARTCRPSACCVLRMNAACACPRTLRLSPSTAPRSRSSPGHPSPWWPSRSRRWPEWPSSSYSTNNGPRAIRPLTGNLSSASPAAACESGRPVASGHPPTLAGWSRSTTKEAQFVEAQRLTAALRTFRPSERAWLAKPATAADLARAFGADQPGPLRAAYPAHGANARER